MSKLNRLTFMENQFSDTLTEPLAFPSGDKPLVTLPFAEQSFPPNDDINLDELKGLILFQETTPTYTPARFSQQYVWVSSGGSSFLYGYDTNSQAWVNIGPSTSTTTTAKTLVPLANFVTNGVALQNPGTGYNTNFQLGQIIVPFKITANSISWYCNAATVAGTVKLVLYSEDGQTQIFQVTTATVATGVVTTALSSVVINPGIYWLGFLVIGAATNIQWEDYSSGGALIGNLWNSVAGKPKVEGFILVTADTIPATISPTGLSNSGNSVLIARFDN